MDSRFTPFHRGGSGSPLVLIHGITDTWRCWDLVLPELERHHDVLALTLPGHAGGPSLPAALTEGVMADTVELAMDDSGFATAHIAGNSLGGYVSLQLATRGRAESVVALAPAGGWPELSGGFATTADYFRTTFELVRHAASHADAIAASPEGRRRATAFITTNFDHIPDELIAHQIRGVAGCDLLPLLDLGMQGNWNLDAAQIVCPVRIVWGTGDRILLWPSMAARYRDELFPHAEWIELDNVGHCPQLDVPLETAQLILGLTAR